MNPGDPLLDDSDDEPDAADPGEVSGVLARRLEQLRDARWLAAVLDSALAQLADQGLAVAGHDIDYCKIKPNRDINVALRARLQGATTAPLRLSCTFYETAAACRRKYAEDEQDAGSAPDGAVAAARRRLLRAGLRRPTVQLDDPPVVVRVFPADPVLRGLPAATDEAEMLPLFASRLEACRRSGTPPRGLVHEVLHYKPRRSCAIHYIVDLGGAAERPARVYGKLSRDDRGARHHELLQAAHDASLRSGGAWRAARPVGYLPQWRLLLQEAVPGRDFRVVFGELTPDDAGPSELQRAGRLLGRIAQALHDLQRAPAPGGPALTFAHLYQAQERNLHYMRGLQPRLAAELAAIRAEALRLERETAPAPPVFAHGDFAHGNVLVDGDEVGIIDFDKAGFAEPAYDVAYFLTHMWSFGIRHPRRMPHVARLCEDFRAACLGLCPAISPARLALYEALDFAAYVLRNFRKQSHQADWLGWAAGQAAAAWQRLGVAAGRKGAAPS